MLFFIRIALQYTTGVLKFFIYYFALQLFIFTLHRSLQFIVIKLFNHYPCGDLATTCIEAMGGGVIQTQNPP